MTPADRLAEAARAVMSADGLYDINIRRLHALRGALAAYDADAERRQAEQDVIAAAMNHPETVDGLFALVEAVRRLREYDQ